MPLDRAVKIAMMACVSAAALALAWGSNYHVVSNHPSASVYIVNTLTGQRTFCGPNYCRALPPA